MELIVFSGIQATGKSSFYKERFSDRCIRINLDMLRTRHREGLLFKACLEAKQPVVIDNTNLRRGERARYIELARTAHFTVIGYYFRSSLEEALLRNKKRVQERQVPDVAIKAASKKLEVPSIDEGFDELNYVSLGPDGFIVEPWRIL